MGGGGALIVIQVARWCLAGGEGWRGSALRVAFVLMGGEWWESALNDMLAACWAGGGWGRWKALIDMMVA